MAENTDLVEIRGLRSSNGYFKNQELLSVDEIYTKLENRSLHKAGKKMKETIERVRSDVFLSFPVEFPVSGLRHTTTKNPMEEILSSQSFQGSQHGRREFIDLSFWGAEVPSSDLEKTREAAYMYTRDQVPQCEAEEYREEITQQFANSPAFNKSASRYGNFSFSFPFSDLLSLYRAQFCDGEEPQLSILGTDIYKQEIAHYVVVHSPGESRFMDFPKVPRLQTREEPLPFVYWKDGTLYWRPQSTADNLRVLTKDGDVIERLCRPRCEYYNENGYCWDTILCMWNHLVVAFHIPDGPGLDIPVQQLVGHLSACATLQPFMKKGEELKLSEAQEIVEEKKRKHGEADD